MIILTLQSWPQDTAGPLIDALIRKGFRVNLPSTVQQIQVSSSQPFASKGTTTALGVDYMNRRIAIQITNNINSPEENVKEVFSILSSIGYPQQEFIERLEIQGNVLIKVIGNKASDCISNIIKQNIAEKMNKIMQRDVKIVGVRISSENTLIDSVNKSPFLILLEPLYTDSTDSKITTQINYATNSGDSAIEFLKNLYDSLKNIILVFANERTI
jgi:hypothetical protein